MEINEKTSKLIEIAQQEKEHATEHIAAAAAAAETQQQLEAARAGWRVGLKFQVPTLLAARELSSAECRTEKGLRL